MVQTNRRGTPPGARQTSDKDYRFTIQNELDLVWHAFPKRLAEQRLGAGMQGCPGLRQGAHAAAKGL
jgi:meso-butanediol dehydrogenase/(S,S)-butanediol dehydrogenase/diacetyl reductase